MQVQMRAYIAKRLLLMIPTLLGVLTLTFAVVQFVPGGPVEQMVLELKGKGNGSVGGSESSGAGATYRGRQGIDEQRLAEVKALYGFDKPPLERYFMMLGRFARFDLGQSYYQHQSVWHLVVSKLPVSISIGLWTFFITYLISIPLGIAKAVREGSRFDTVTSTIILVGYAIPGFVLGVLLLVLFGGGSFLQLFPLRGLTSDNWSDLSLIGKILDYLWHLVLPITAMVLGSFAVVTMLTKNSFLEEIRKQYVLTARAKGLSEHQVLWKHVFRNALLPLVTGFPAAFIGAFFTGSLLIETLFSLDGLGLLSYESVMRRDYPVVFGTLYLFTLIGLFTKLISDLCYVYIDPRIQFGAGGGLVSHWQRFKRNRTGYISLWIFMVLFGISMCADFIANDKPLIVRYDGHFYFPIVRNQPETVFGGDFATPTDFLDPDIRHNITSDGNWAIYPLIPYSYETLNYFSRVPNPAPPSAELVWNRRPWARCSVTLDLRLSVIDSVWSCTHDCGCWRGYHHWLAYGLLWRQV